MKKSLLLLSMAVFAFAANAQTTYNYFDPADVDSEGWLWFDTQAKIDKYVGFGEKYKIQLQPCGYENEDMEYAEPYADPEIPGYNAEGEEGGEGAKFGAIALCPSSKSFGSDAPDGGGFMMWLPDCAKFDAYVSCGTDAILIGLKANDGEWVKPIDTFTVKTWMKMGWLKPLMTAYQCELPDLQAYQNANAPYTTIASAEGEKVTALFTNNGKELLVHGIRVLTYTNTIEDAGIANIASDGLALSIADGVARTNACATIAVYNAAGAEVAKAHGNALELSNLPKGTYVVKAAAATNVVVVKTTI